ncbi:MAG: 4-alpha-glucanotransferase [Gaiellaceae bacterium]
MLNELQRSSGVLLHPTSLPGRRLGEEAYRFVDWLAAAGQSWWQMLPLGPPDAWGSPYTASSAFAGWPGLLADPNAPVDADEIESFVARHPYWAGDWAAFAGAGALTGQVRFEREWGALRSYAAARGVRLLGDLPIYVATGSADHLAHPRLFQHGPVAGAPPDALTRNGQLWGNPLYDWGMARSEHYRWWIERFRRTFELFDLTRLDHFRGFVSYWSVPEGMRTARTGHWRPGPGLELFRAVERELGALPLIAEDLGVITEPVYRLRDTLGLPGMAVLQYAFEGARSSPHRLENHRENLVVYTSTHDHDTARGWWEGLGPREQKATGLDPADPIWSLIELGASSPARLLILPAQDVLGLGSEARMNRPGEAEGNWRWGLRRGQLTDTLAARLRAVTEAAGRASTDCQPARAPRPNVDGRARP